MGDIARLGGGKVSHSIIVHEHAKHTCCGTTLAGLDSIWKFGSGSVFSAVVVSVSFTSGGFSLVSYKYENNSINSKKPQNKTTFKHSWTYGLSKP